MRKSLTIFVSGFAGAASLSMFVKGEVSSGLAFLSMMFAFISLANEIGNRR